MRSSVVLFFVLKFRTSYVSTAMELREVYSFCMKSVSSSTCPYGVYLHSLFFFIIVIHS